MELKLAIQYDEDKLKELVEEAVARLKSEGYIWRDNPPPYNGGHLERSDDWWWNDE